MSAIAAVPPTQAGLDLQPVQLDAFQPNAAQAAGPSPDAIAQSVLSGLHSFSGHELAFRTQTENAIKGHTTTTDAAGKAGMSTQEMLARSDQMQSENLGMIMQTYSFALEATLVTNAATTFTSSINTLIKTQ